MAAINYAQQYADFQKLSFDGRKNIVIELLEPLRQHNETLQTIYEYLVTSENITDQDLLEVYESVWYGMKENDDNEMQKSLHQLDAIKDRILEQKRIEEEERKKEVASADELLMDF